MPAGPSWPRSSPRPSPRPSPSNPHRRPPPRFVRPDYIQHNPLASDGTEALKNLGTALHRQFPDAEYGIERVIAEGDLVLVHSNVVLTPGTLGNTVVDIFRFRNGRIVEHWDVIQDVPATSANDNTMF